MEQNKDIQSKDSTSAGILPMQCCVHVPVDLFGHPIEKDELLRDKFIEPPFSTLDSKSGSWRDRVRKWKKLGFKSELGRSELKTKNGNLQRLISNSDHNAPRKDNISIFDPALAELIYHWFCPTGGLILDPFAGGSVRGIVANYLGFKYTGIDIRQEQIDSNREQCLQILPINNQPQYYVGDSSIVLNEFTKKFDCVFTCPPYVGLEVYSNLQGDISNMDYNNFVIKYTDIIQKAINKLKVGGWFIIVVGEVRGKDGYYLNFCGKTKDIIIEDGCKLYNEMIYVTPIGAKAMTANRLMKNKKIGKIHEFVYVFRKV